MASANLEFNYMASVWTSTETCTPYDWKRTRLLILIARLVCTLELGTAKDTSTIKVSYCIISHHTARLPATEMTSFKNRERHSRDAKHHQHHVAMFPPGIYTTYTTVWLGRTKRIPVVTEVALDSLDMLH